MPSTSNKPQVPPSTSEPAASAAPASANGPAFNPEDASYPAGPSSKALFLFRTYFHPLISIFLPFFFLMTIVIVARDGFPVFRDLPILIVPMLLFVGFAEAVIGNTLYKVRAGMFSRFRELIVLMVIVFGVALIYSPGATLVQRIVSPSPATILFVFAGALQWFLSFISHEALRERELFLDAIKNKSGEALQLALRNAMTLAETAQYQLKSLKNMSVFFELIVIFQFIFCRMLGLPLSVLQVSLLFLHTAATFFMISMTNMFIGNSLFLAEGINPNSKVQKRRLGFAFLIILICLALGLVFAAETSLLPPNWLIDFLNWIFSFFTASDGSRIVLPQLQAPNLDFFYSDNQSQGTDPAVDLAWLFTALKILIIVVIVGGIAFAVFRPFLSKEFREYMKGKNPFRFIAERIAFLVRGMFHGIRDFFRNLFSPKNRYIDSEEFRHLVAASKKEDGKIRRSSLNRILRLLVRYARWGKRSGVVFTVFHTITEYSDALGHRFPDHAASFSRATGLFNELIFSEGSGREEEIDRLAGLVKEISSWKAG